MVNPMYFCFQTQITANNDRIPHTIKYLMRIFGLEIYKEKTIKADISWNAIIRAEAYQAPTSSPMPQVSLSTSNVQKPHQTINVKNIMFPQRLNGVSLRSIMAKEMRMISKISLYKDIGILEGRGLFFHCSIKLMPIKAQKESMRYLNTAIVKSSRIGIEQIIAKKENPEVINEIIAKENRRRSSNTLPPFSPVNDPPILAIFIWRDCSLLPLNQVVISDRQSC